MRRRLPDSYARMGQGLILLLFVPLNVFTWIIVIHSSVLPAPLLFALLMTLFSMVIVLLSFKAADVSIEKDIFIIKRIFGITKISSQRYKRIGPLLCFGYYLEFEGRRRVYVLFGPDEMIKQITNFKSKDLIDEIESLIRQELNV